jgi:uncharacterized membrane protein YbhN (UPF0104 family)
MIKGIRRENTIKKFLFAWFFFFALIFILTQISEFSEILGILNHAKPLFVFLALILILVWIATLGFSYFVIYRLVGIKETYLHMVTLSSAAINFVGIVTPSAGISTLLCSYLMQREVYFKCAVTFACMLYPCLLFCAVITALVGLLILQANHQLTWLEIAATACWRNHWRVSFSTILK